MAEPSGSRPTKAEQAEDKPNARSSRRLKELNEAGGAAGHKALHVPDHGIKACSLFAQQQTTKEQLLGTWKVLNLKAVTDDKVSYPLGDQVTGYVTITPARIWLLFVDSTRKAPAAASLTDAESIAMMKSQVAWTGKYSTTDQTSEGIKLTAHVDTASSQAITGNDRVYFMRVDGDKLMVKSPGVIVPMTGAKSIVEFALVKAD